MTKKEFEKRCNEAMVKIYESWAICQQIEANIGSPAYRFFARHFKPKNKGYYQFWYGKPIEQNSSMRLAVFCDFINLVMETKEYKKW